MHVEDGLAAAGLELDDVPGGPAAARAAVAAARFSRVTKFITRRPPGLEAAEDEVDQFAEFAAEPPMKTASGSGQPSR